MIKRLALGSALLFTVIPVVHGEDFVPDDKIIVEDVVAPVEKSELELRVEELRSYESAINDALTTVSNEKVADSLIALRNEVQDQIKELESK